MFYGFFYVFELDAPFFLSFIKTLPETFCCDVVIILTAAVYLVLLFVVLLYSTVL